MLHSLSNTIIKVYAFSERSRLRSVHHQKTCTASRTLSSWFSSCQMKILSFICLCKDRPGHFKCVFMTQRIERVKFTSIIMSKLISSTFCPITPLLLHFNMPLDTDETEVLLPSKQKRTVTPVPRLGPTFFRTRCYLSWSAHYLVTFEKGWRGWRYWCIQLLSKGTWVQVVPIYNWSWTCLLWHYDY